MLLHTRLLQLTILAIAPLGVRCSLAAARLSVLLFKRFIFAIYMLRLVKKRKGTPLTCYLLQTKFMFTILL